MYLVYFLTIQDIELNRERDFMLVPALVSWWQGLNVTALIFNAQRWNIQLKMLRQHECHGNNNVIKYRQAPGLLNQLTSYRLPLWNTAVLPQWQNIQCDPRKVLSYNTSWGAGHDTNGEAWGSRESLTFVFSVILLTYSCFLFPYQTGISDIFTRARKAGGCGSPGVHG